MNLTPCKCMCIGSASWGPIPASQGKPRTQEPVNGPRSSLSIMHTVHGRQGFCDPSLPAAEFGDLPVLSLAPPAAP